MAKSSFEWDGEKIKQTIERQEHKVNTKDYLDRLFQLRSQIDNMKNQKEQMEKQIKILSDNINRATEDEKQLKEFEDKAVEIQKDKLRQVIESISDGCKEQAIANATRSMESDKNIAYTEEQKNNHFYLDYQRNLATHEKVAEKISQHIIKKYLYEQPLFNNPFSQL